VPFILSKEELDEFNNTIQEKKTKDWKL